MIGSIKAQMLLKHGIFIITKTIIILRSKQAVTLDFPTIYYSHSMRLMLNEKQIFYEIKTDNKNVIIGYCCLGLFYVSSVERAIRQFLLLF